MFKGKKKEINPSTTDTLIGEGSVFEGRIKSEASIRIEGQLTGDIDCTGDVTVGENGAVRSNISARDVIIAGQVTGNVTAKGKLTILATGHLSGNTNAPAFVIEQGGVFQGSSKMEKSGVTNASGQSQSQGQSQNQSYELEHAAKGAVKSFAAPVSDRLGGGNSAAL